MGCWKHLSKNMDLAQFLLSTRAKAAISLVFGSATKGHKRTQKDTMDPLRRQRLEALPGWSWDVFSDQWEEGFAHLKEFSVRVGHCRVPFTYKSDDNYGLGTWVANQRKAGPGTSATPRGTARLVMGCLFGPVGRRFRSSERIFRACGSLPSAGYPQERQRLPTRAVD